MELGNEKWIPVAEAAQRTGYSVSMVQRLCQKKRIKCIKLGRDWFVDASDIMRWKTEVYNPNKASRYPKTQEDDEEA